MRTYLMQWLRSDRGSTKTTDAGPMYAWEPADELGIDAHVATHVASKMRSARKNETPEEAQARKDNFKKHCEQLVELLHYRHEEGKTTVTVDGKLEVLAATYSELHRCPQIRARSAKSREIGEGGSKFNTRLRYRFMYWWPPVLMFWVCFTVQSMLLHIATFHYIRYMEAYDDVMGGAKPTNSSLDPERIAMIKDGRLLDLVGDALGPKRDVPLVFLDLTGAVPALVFAGSYAVAAIVGEDNAGLWTKTFLVGSIMAIIKGIFDVVTILPDSSGYKNCKARLGDFGMAEVLSWQEWGLGGFWGKMSVLFLSEVMGIQASGGTKRIRYCADMMTSGHTYFAVMFSLSTYKMLVYSTQSEDRIYFDCETRRFRRSNSPKKCGLKIRHLRYVVLLVCLSCVGAELILVALTKFHYTVDMLASIVLVCVLWDSIYIETVVSKWIEGYNWKDSSWEWSGLGILLGCGCQSNKGCCRRKRKELPAAEEVHVTFRPGKMGADYDHFGILRNVSEKFKDITDNKAPGKVQEGSRIVAVQQPPGADSRNRKLFSKRALEEAESSNKKYEVTFQVLQACTSRSRKLVNLDTMRQMIVDDPDIASDEEGDGNRDVELGYHKVITAIRYATWQTNFGKVQFVGETGIYLGVPGNISAVKWLSSTQVQARFYNRDTKKSGQLHWTFDGPECDRFVGKWSWDDASFANPQAWTGYRISCHEVKQNARSTAKMSLTITVVSVTGDHHEGRDAYCTLEVEKVQVARTKTMKPHWKEDLNIREYVAGQDIVFKVWHCTGGFVGQAILASDQVLSGTVVPYLVLQGGGCARDKATLDVQVAVHYKEQTCQVEDLKIGDVLEVRRTSGQWQECVLVKKTPQAITVCLTDEERPLKFKVKDVHGHIRKKPGQ